MNLAPRAIGRKLIHMELLPNSHTEPDGSALIRVLSYNIRSMRDDTDALARVITACAPDLVLIQEAPASSAGARNSPAWPARRTS